jgi:asparagine synthase (glutamine-hydrolysing)
MSFIYGIINLDGKPVKHGEIMALAQAVKWEGFKEHFEVDGNYAIGYCHHPERQPKAGIFKDKGLIVLADIRIYNAEELKKSMDYTRPEEAFAKAYRIWGVDCANHINGDFAAVVFDQKKTQVHLFRDHIGTRPLTYWFSERNLIFASHEFGLVKSGLFLTSLSEKKLIARFFSRWEIYEQTIFNLVQKVVPGHCVSFDARGHRQITKYWKPENIQKSKTLTFEAAAAGLQERIVKATRNRMVQGKTGLHVSGGLDSCGVSSVVADHTPDKSLLTGYSWSPEIFEDKVEGVNEKEFIDAFSVDKKVLVKYLNLGDFETVKNAILPEFEIQHIEHPVMQMAEKDSVEILFSGWGGDEFTSLSTRGVVNYLFFRFKWLTLLKYCKVKGILSTLYQLRTNVLPLLIPFGLLPIYEGQHTEWSLLKLFNRTFIFKHWRQLVFHKSRNLYGYGNRTQFAHNLLNMYYLPELMDSWSINSEKYGFEYKYPLLDKDVLEFWFSIPLEYTYKDFYSRLLYREAMRGILTEKIRTRKDKGEAIRIASFFKEQLNGKKYLIDLFRSLPQEDHLSFFKPQALISLVNQPISKEPIKNWRKISKLTFYLRYVALVKKYLPNQDLTKTR